MRIFVVLCLVQAVVAQDGKVQPELAASWRAGQTWRVEYTRPAPSPVASPSRAALPAGRSVWTYRVVESGPQIRIEAVEDAGPGRYEVWFNAAPVVLRRVAKIAGGGSFDLIVHSANTPYSGWSQDFPIIFDWPSLPRSPRSFSRSFLDDDGQHAMEVVRFPDPSRFEIVTMVKRRVDSGYDETRRCTQKWKVGSPWWSEAAVETERTIDGKKSVQQNLSGRLLP